MHSVGRRRHIAPVVFLIAVALLAVASARPQITLPVPRMEGVVVLALDVSSSMVADDVETHAGWRQPGWPRSQS